MPNRKSFLRPSLSRSCKSCNKMHFCVLALKKTKSSPCKQEVLGKERCFCLSIARTQILKTKRAISGTLARLRPAVKTTSIIVSLFMTFKSCWLGTKGHFAEKKNADQILRQRFFLSSRFFDDELKSARRRERKICTKGC